MFPKVIITQNMHMLTALAVLHYTKSKGDDNGKGYTEVLRVRPQLDCKQGASSALPGRVKSFCSLIHALSNTLRLFTKFLCTVLAAS